MYGGFTIAWLLCSITLLASRGFAGSVPADVEVRLVPSTVPQAKSQLPGDALYFVDRYDPSVGRYVLAGQLASPSTFWIEVWVSDVGSLNTGVTSAYFDVAWDSRSIATVTGFAHSPLFNLFPEGATDNGNGVVTNFGGSDATFSGQGVEPTYARVGWIEYSFTGNGNLSVDATVGLGEVGVRNRTAGPVQIIGASVRPCPVGPDFDGDALADSCDPDIDQDGVPNEQDECDFTPLSLPQHLIESDGTVLGDLDGDCDVDLQDYTIMQERYSGPG